MKEFIVISFDCTRGSLETLMVCYSCWHLLFPPTFSLPHTKQSFCGFFDIEKKNPHWHFDTSTLCLRFDVWCKWFLKVVKHAVVRSPCVLNFDERGQRKRVSALFPFFACGSSPFSIENPFLFAEVGEVVRLEILYEHYPLPHNPNNWTSARHLLSASVVVGWFGWYPSLMYPSLMYPCLMYPSPLTLFASVTKGTSERKVMGLVCPEERVVRREA